MQNTSDSRQYVEITGETLLDTHSILNSTATALYIEECEPDLPTKSTKILPFFTFEKIASVANLFGTFGESYVACKPIQDNDLSRVIWVREKGVKLLNKCLEKFRFFEGDLALFLPPSPHRGHSREEHRHSSSSSSSSFYRTYASDSIYAKRCNTTIYEEQSTLDNIIPHIHCEFAHKYVTGSINEVDLYMHSDAHNISGSVSNPKLSLTDDLPIGCRVRILHRIVGDSGERLYVVKPTEGGNMFTYYTALVSAEYLVTEEEFAEQFPLVADRHLVFLQALTTQARESKYEPGTLVRTRGDRQYVYTERGREHLRGLEVNRVWEHYGIHNEVAERGEEYVVCSTFEAPTEDGVGDCLYCVVCSYRPDVYSIRPIRLLVLRESDLEEVDAGARESTQSASLS